MVTAYIDKEYWADRRKGMTWAQYTAAYPQLDADKLEAALEDATIIINDDNHIACRSSNISDDNYLDRIKRLCYDLSLRILIDSGNLASEGSTYRWSEADKMFAHERTLCLSIGLNLGHREVGGVR